MRSLDRYYTYIQPIKDSYEIHAYLPEAGDYIFRIYSKFKDKPGKYEDVLDYKIEASKGISKYELPVSPKPAFFRNELKIISHPYRIIKVEGQIKILLRASKDVRLYSLLQQNDNTLPESLTFIQRNLNGEYEIHAVFPNTGEYILKLFAKNKEDVADAELSLSYIIEVNNGFKGMIGFPKTYPVFNEYGVYLYGPMDGYLKSGSTQKFHLKVPGADKVAVIINNEWFYLKKIVDLFEGNILIINKGKIEVCAEFPDKSVYKVLLQYSVY